MSGLPRVASSILANASRNVDVAAQNIANMTTPGYKRKVAFSQLLANRDTVTTETGTNFKTDLSPGKLVDTGSPYDLAVLGEGFFIVRDADQRLLYTRQGQFTRDPSGRLVTAGGLTLQAEGGGDLVLRGEAVSVGSDGVVLEAGQPVARLMLATLPVDAERAEGGAFVAAQGDFTPVENPAIRQGAYEASNVVTADEMVAMMAALRRAESGQRLMTVYDDLMGRVLTTFGQA